MGWLSWTINLLLITGVIFIMVKMKDEEETYYILKIIGYYLLGVLRLSFNKIHIPLGFIIFLLLLRSPQNNLRGKRYAAILGLAAFIVTLITPTIGDLYYERTRYMELPTTNVYEFDFPSHWEEVAKMLELEEGSIGTAKIEDLNIDYKKDGELKGLYYEVIWREEGKLHHGWVDFNEAKKKLSLRATEVEQWVQYNRLISAKRLFNKLEQVNIDELTPVGDFFYYGLNAGEWGSFGIGDGNTFVIEENRILPFKGELPVECYWMVIFGMKKTGEYSYSSEDYHYYLFDVIYE